MIEAMGTTEMDEPKTISKKAYDQLVMWLVIAIGLVVAVGSPAIARACGYRLDPGILSGLAIVYIALARGLAEWFLRRRGLTRRGIVSEVHARSPFEPEEDIEPGETVEARLPRGMILFLLIGLLVMGLFFLAGSRVVAEEPGWRWLSLGLGSFMLLYFFAIILDRKPQARIDADGVTGYPSHNAVRRRFVPWSDVFSCEVQTFYDTFGKPFLLRPILKGRDGETLMKLSLAYTPMVEQERIVKAIKVRLPETVVDAWLA